MSNRRQVFGRWGEDAAAEYLTANGYTVLARNVHSAHGEIDIVASKDGLLVFVEVKTRSSHTFAYPEDSVTRRKQAYMLSAAEEYLQAHPESGESWQFDVIAVEGTPGGKAQIEHFENVIG
ncbi:MAG: YraN family protein [Anaerolineales bacterium]|jgi:putative endonuclease|nr:YraN family protein [Chloroflexota bacterium]MDP2994562.1 YraN family protein [Anaerolineales bacterium]